MKKNIKINMIPVQSKSLCAKCIRNDFGELCHPSQCDSCVQHSDVPLHYSEESTLQQTEVRCKCLSEEYYGKPCHGFVREPDSKDITVHHLKCCKPFFDDIWEGKKLFELRKNDRNYGVDDELVLHEYDTYLECITNRTIEATIDYIFGDAQFGLKDGYCILGLKYLHNEE